MATRPTPPRWRRRFQTNQAAFSPRQRRAIGLIADTFAPQDAGGPSATATGAIDLTLDLAARNPRTSEVQQLKLLLACWDTRVLGLLLLGSRRRFSELRPSEREAALLALADSRIASKRRLFAALKGASLLPYYLSFADDGLPEMGYPGSLGLNPNPPTPALGTLNLDHDTNLSCDVVIVGSGAGGGTAAGVLAAAGLDVIVIEAGQLHDERHFDGGERVGLLDLYSWAPQMTLDSQILLVAGRGVGGGTVVNWTTSFRTPDHVRAEWASLGADQFMGSEYDDSMDAVSARIGVNTDHDRAGPRDVMLEKGARALGWNCAAMPRNVLGCDQDTECGRCGMGCRIGAKQSTAKTWLADAVDAGARLIADTTVTRVTKEAGRATGVDAVTAGGKRLTVQARAVVVAAGAIQTPALLQRSGLTNPNIGRHLRLHPGSALWAVFDERVDPWTGSMQSRYVDQITNLDGDGYGILLETAPITPAFGSSFIGWPGAKRFRERMAGLGHQVGFAVILRDKDSVGTVKAGRDGEPIVKYKLSPHDSEHIVQGHIAAARIAEAAGAHTIYTSHHREVGYRPGRSGDINSFSRDLRAEGTAPGRMAMASLHLMGTTRMGGSPATSAVDPDGQTWEVKGLYVADGSCFPTASGVNPMLSIESIAHMTAKRLAWGLR